ncbi:MAG: hydrogenase expression/formation protein HypE [Spirochaetota bacterium]
MFKTTQSDTIRLAHGFGGKLTQDLLDAVIYPALSGKCGHIPTLDAAVIENLKPPIVVSTDSFTITPRFFPGGDIGKLSVAGTVNDVVMMGGDPRFLTLGIIIEEGFDLEELKTIFASIGGACRQAGVTVVSGDTKVVGQGAADGIFINTTGFGSRICSSLGLKYIRDGDAIIITGTIGDHGAAILNAREKLKLDLELESDCASLNWMLEKVLKKTGDAVHALRDPTRGGIAATLHEFAYDTGLQYTIREEDIPIKPVVRSFLDILGMDPLILANEGKALIFAEQKAVPQILDILHSDILGAEAAVIGYVEKPPAKGTTEAGTPFNRTTADGGQGRGRVILETTIGTKRIVEMPLEHGLPRIC